ncbi:MAG: GGDEF domain-containing protein [Proteobacteria bacterium]|nr:GGDEF domain-containing protein [Pseudomonadota bacterium]
MADHRSGEFELSSNEAFSADVIRLFGLGGLLTAGGLLVLAVLQSAPWEALGLLALVVGAAAVSAISAARGAHRVAARTFAVTFMVAAVTGMFLFGGAETSAAVSVISGVALCGVLLGRRGMLGAVVFGIAAAAVVGWGAAAGWLPESIAPNTPMMSAGAVIGNIVMVSLVFLAGRRALDVTEEDRKKVRRRLVQSEDVDPASSTLSRSALRRAIDALLADPIARRESALLIIGLDPGQLLRVGFGPDNRDAALRTVADRLRAVTRPHDRIGRCGDAEFAVLAPRVGSAGHAIAVAQRILDAIDQPLAVEGKPIALNFRVGVAAVAEEHTTSSLLRDGDVALASAGRLKGDNIGVFEAGVVQHAQRALELDADLARALAEGELEAYYQPVVSLAHGGLEGFEALVRWNKPDGSVVSPAEFLPRAESTGAIVEIDRLVLRQACRQLAIWMVSHPDLSPWVSVNLSAAQFETPGLVAVVAGAIEDAGITPGRLHLELTESALTADIDRTCATLSELKELGVVLALDDFGTGWSSLQYIQSYPMDVVKIDRSFISPIDEEGGQELAATIVFMARELGLEVIGEGVETRTQYRVLRDLGVQAGQGFHFSRPVPAKRAVRYLKPPLEEEPSRPWTRLFSVVGDD